MPKANVDAGTPRVLRRGGGRVTIRFLFTVLGAFAPKLALVAGFGFTAFTGFTAFAGFRFTGFEASGVLRDVLRRANAFAASFARVASFVFTTGFCFVAVDFFGTGLLIAARAGATFALDATRPGGDGLVVLATAALGILAL